MFQVFSRFELTRVYYESSEEGTRSADLPRIGVKDNMAKKKLPPKPEGVLVTAAKAIGATAGKLAVAVGAVTPAPPAAKKAVKKTLAAAPKGVAKKAVKTSPKKPAKKVATRP